jgi:ribose transport system substrate-binding protein
MKRLSFIISFPGHNMYLREQEAAARSTAARLGVNLQFLNGEMDPLKQSQELLEIIQSRTEPKPDAILLEPVSAQGMPRVAESAVNAGIAWVVSNALVDYIGTLRAKSKVLVFQVSQDHVEIGRIQGRQIGALLPEGGSVLYLRGPAMNSVGQMRFEGLEDTQPTNVQVRSLKIQATADSSYTAVCSWLTSGRVRPEETQLVVSQNVDFILGARKAFEANTTGADRAKWLSLPCVGAGVASQLKPMVDQGTLRAAVLTSLTMDTALEILVRAMGDGSQPQEKTFVDAQSYPTLEQLAKDSNWVGVR